jgi:hypothetical protein
MRKSIQVVFPAARVILHPVPVVAHPPVPPYDNPGDMTFKIPGVQINAIPSAVVDVAFFHEDVPSALHSQPICAKRIFPHESSSPIAGHLKI